MSLQNLILTYAYEKQNKLRESLTQRPNYSQRLDMETLELMQPLLAQAENRPKSSVEDILANVQKVSF